MKPIVLAFFCALAASATNAQAGFFDTLTGLAGELLDEVITPDSKASFADQKAILVPASVQQLYSVKEQQALQAQKAFALTPDDKALLNNNGWKYYLAGNSVFDSEVFVLEAGKRGNPALVLVHGLGQNGLRDWLNVIPEFEHQYHIIALDQQGFGLSPATSGQYSPTNFATVVHQVVLAFGIKNYTLVGHSMGGAVSLRYASLFGDEMRQLVLVDAAGILERTAFLKYSVEFPQYLDSLPDIPLKWVRGVEEFNQSMVESIAGWPDAVELVRKFQYAWDKTLARSPNVNAATALIYEDFSSAVHETDVPTSIIWGAQDGVTPTRTGHMLNNALPQSRLDIIEKCGHTPMRENPQAFNQLLRASLQNLPKKNKAPAMRLSRSNKKLVIANQVNEVYSGDYGEIEIVDSRAINLQGVNAKQISVKNSSVNLQNVYLAADTTAIMALASVIEGTNVSITANNGILADNSRIDLANANLVTEGEAVNVAQDSQVIFSVSRVATPAYRGYVHGQYRSENTAINFASEDK